MPVIYSTEQEFQRKSHTCPNDSVEMSVHIACVRVEELFSSEHIKWICHTVLANAFAEQH